MARIGSAATDRVDLGSGNLFSSATASGTLSCWIRPVTAHATIGTILGIGGGTTGSQALWSFFVYADEKLGIQCRQTNAGTYNEIKSNGAATLDAWNHVVLQSSGSAWSFWLNGVSQSLTTAAGSNTGAWLGDCTPSTTIKTVLLGLFHDGSYIQGCVNVDVAEIGLWNGVQLGTGEIAALAAGYAPRMIRPASLSAYWDLRRDIFDWKAYRSAQTITGTSVTAHPRMFYAVPRLLLPAPTTETLVELAPAALTWNGRTLSAPAISLAAAALPWAGVTLSILMGFHPADLPWRGINLATVIPLGVEDLSWNGQILTVSDPTLVLDWISETSRVAAAVILLLDWEVLARADAGAVVDPVLVLDWEVISSDPILALSWDVISEALQAAQAADQQVPTADATLESA